MEPYRISKALTKEVVAKLAPQYLEILKDVKDLETWRKVSEGMEEIRKRLKLESYVLLYDDPLKIRGVAVASIMSADERSNLEKDIKTRGVVAEEEIIRQMLDDLDDYFREIDELDIEQAIAEFEQLNDPEKLERLKQAQLMYCAAFAWLADALALMVHGEPMTQLVSKAKHGNKAAFAKACHIDRTLLFEHPWFKEHFLQAQIKNEEKLLTAVAYRAGKPITQGQAKQAGLLVVFKLLDDFRWLDDFTHTEIADLCDKIGLGIEVAEDGDLNVISIQSITKCLMKYRQYKKSI